MVGTLEPRKDHASVVVAFERVRRRHPEVSLVLAGASGWLLARDAGRPSPPGVIALGWVSDAELDALYRNAVMVVSASIYEGFGLSVLEALARGIPVVATGIPAHIELTGHAAMHFAPGDISMLAAEMEELLTDSAAHDELGRAAIQRAKRFSIPATIEGHLAAYETAVAVGLGSRESSGG